MTTSSDRPVSPILAWGFGLGALGIILGAFGAHALAPHITAKALETFKTGQFYHMLACLVLIALGVLDTTLPRKAWRTSAWLIGIGLAVFSGSLYLLAVTGMRWLGAVTPLGGLFQIAGWVSAAWASWFVRKA